MQVLPEGYPFERGDIQFKTSEIETNPKWGKRPEERTVEGLLDFGVMNIDKPANLTSHEVSAFIKKFLGVKKVAHGGTLDPKVTGILPIALNRATPIARTWLGGNKEYVMVIKFHGDFQEDELRKVFKEFEGEIYQRPPIKSAVVRRTRIRKIYEIEFIERLERFVLVRVKCQAGTYMRKLATDIGDVLGVGANMYELRRISSGGFREDETLRTLHDLVDAWHFYKENGEEGYLRSVILPAERGILHLPRIIINDGAVGAITYGAPLFAPGVVALTMDIKPGSLFAILTLKGELAALAISDYSSEKILKMEKGKITRDTRVLMPRDIYPPMWKPKVEGD
ncbi:MAG: RNA-guided pseudouridylation complex pseudouridine synthase subunit Cbf5 [Candidatus Njordarchaeia archaeon]